MIMDNRLDDDKSNLPAGMTRPPSSLKYVSNNDKISMSKTLAGIQQYSSDVPNLKPSIEFINGGEDDGTQHRAVTTLFEVSLDRRPNSGRRRLTDSSFSLTKSLRSQEEFAVRRRCSMHSSMKLGERTAYAPQTRRRSRSLDAVEAMLRERDVALRLESSKSTSAASDKTRESARRAFQGASEETNSRGSDKRRRHRSNNDSSPRGEESVGNRGEKISFFSRQLSISPLAMCTICLCYLLSALLCLYLGFFLHMKFFT